MSHWYRNKRLLVVMTVVAALAALLSSVVFSGALTASDTTEAADAAVAGQTPAQRASATASTLQKDDSDPQKVISMAVEPGAQVRALTRAEMLSAKPLPLPKASGGPVTGAVPEAVGEPGLIPGGERGVAGTATMDLLGEEGVAPTYLPVNINYSYPPPFTIFRVFASGDYTRYPQRTIGVLFFQKRGSSTWWRCSASVAVNKAVWTAGHCVHEGNSSTTGWHRNYVFVPAYRDGAAPYGQWSSAATASTLNGWYYGAKFPYDIGMVSLNLNGSGRKISQVVGFLGFAYNQSRLQHWHAIGYPVAAPFDGKYAWFSTASHAWDDARFGSPYTIGIGSNQTGGTSGGPWLRRYYPDVSGAANYVNGVNSYRYTSPAQPNAIHGPYFTTGALNLYNWALAR